MDWNELYNLGLGFFEKTTAFFEEALEMKPDPEACYNQGVALGNSGKFQEAIACYDKTLAIKPDFYLAWYNRGVMLGNLGRFEAAIASYDKT
ncbi:tetratricopeptide repeat protein, partial [Microcoleus sp. B4-D4]|uniref:tetratricopeptide repeat protein n=1 Tax=Microcoleus sp. B4-D4 TaxID=2818667 RepID=UPI002FD4FD3F